MIIEQTKAFVSILIDGYGNDGGNNAPEISRPKSVETSVSCREVHSTKSYWLISLLVRERGRTSESADSTARD